MAKQALGNSRGARMGDSGRGVVSAINIVSYADSPHRVARDLDVGKSSRFFGLLILDV